MGLIIQQPATKVPDKRMPQSIDAPPLSVRSGYIVLIDGQANPQRLLLDANPQRRRVLVKVGVHAAAQDFIFFYFTDSGATAPDPLKPEGLALGITDPAIELRTTDAIWVWAPQGDGTHQCEVTFYEETGYAL